MELKTPLFLFLFLVEIRADLRRPLAFSHMVDSSPPPKAKPHDFLNENETRSDKACIL